jgi:hypothetical protein
MIMKFTNLVYLINVYLFKKQPKIRLILFIEKALL